MAQVPTDVLTGLEDAAEAAFRQLAPREFLNVEFYRDARPDEEASKKAGRHVFRDVECIRIRTPGETDFIDREVSDEDRRRFSEKYRLFKADDDQEKVDGFPLKQWPLVTEAQRRELLYFGVRTVEQMANISDVALQRVGHYQRLRQQAKDWLAKADEASVMVRLRSENDDLRARITTLEQMVGVQAKDIEEARSAGGVLSKPAPDDRVAALEAKMSALIERLAAPPKRMGRPPGSKNKPKVVPGNGTTEG